VSRKHCRGCVTPGDLIKRVGGPIEFRSFGVSDTSESNSTGSDKSMELDP
jgi:hypothetical protein